VRSLCGDGGAHRLRVRACRCGSSRRAPGARRRGPERQALGEERRLDRQTLASLVASVLDPAHLAAEDNPVSGWRLGRSSPTFSRRWTALSSASGCEVETAPEDLAAQIGCADRHTGTVHGPKYRLPKLPRTADIRKTWPSARWTTGPGGSSRVSHRQADAGRDAALMYLAHAGYARR
jgi:hypothetical protein